MEKIAVRPQDRQLVLKAALERFEQLDPVTERRLADDLQEAIFRCAFHLQAGAPA